MTIRQHITPLASDGWRWSIWLEEPDLDSIDHVVYTLHPTFHPRFVQVDDRASGFKLTRESSSPFTIGLRIERRGGEASYSRHTLAFNQAKRRRVLISHPSDLDDDRVTEALLIAERLGWEVVGARGVLPPGVSDRFDVEGLLAESVGVIVVEDAMPSRWVLHELQTARSLGKPIVSIGGGWASRSVDADEIHDVRAVGDVLMAWADDPDAPSTYPPPSAAQLDAEDESCGVWKEIVMNLVDSLRSLAAQGAEAALYTLPTRLLSAADRLSEILNAAGSAGGATKDWLLHINSARIIQFCRRRYPEQFAQLDDGDKLILASFLDPNFVSNTRSLLGDPAFDRAEFSELDLTTPELGRMLVEMFGRNATFASPPQVFATARARQGAERWYFINGISTSPELALRNAQRLEQLFGKDFITIYNPTQGFVLDLVESALQKFTNVNTETVGRAFVELVDGLTDPEVDKVRVVAHSQGSIVMGDVLDLIYYAIHDEFYRFTNMNSKDIDDFLGVSHGTLKSDELRQSVKLLEQAVLSTDNEGRTRGARRIDESKRRALLSKLELYLFANAASNICYMHTDEGSEPLPLVESFANEHDAVARLGCLAKDRLHATGLIRIDGPTFVGAGRYGHLLNLHYLADFEAAFCSKTPAYRLLPVDRSAPCVGASLNDPVRANPCALNPLHVSGPVRLSSNLVRLFEARNDRRPAATLHPPTIPEPIESVSRAPRAPSEAFESGMRVSA